MDPGRTTPSRSGLHFRRTAETVFTRPLDASSTPDTEFAEQRSDAGPGDCHTDAERDERRELQRDRHTRRPDPRADPMRITIGQEDRPGDETGTYDGALRGRCLAGPRAGLQRIVRQRGEPPVARTRLIRPTISWLSDRRWPGAAAPTHLPEDKALRSTEHRSGGRGGSNWSWWPSAARNRSAPSMTAKAFSARRWSTPIVLARLFSRRRDAFTRGARQSTPRSRATAARRPPDHAPTAAHREAPGSRQERR